jgi:hypothetical protein
MGGTEVKAYGGEEHSSRRKYAFHGYESGSARNSDQTQMTSRLSRE